MNKAQKIIVLVAILMILFSIVYPPYLEITTFAQEKAISGAGLDWIFNSFGQTIKEPKLVIVIYRKIRFDILLCEILAVGVLAGFFIVLITKPAKRKR